MQISKPFESQGMRLLTQLFLRGKRIFNMLDILEAAQLETIPRTQVRKILSNLAKQRKILRLRRGLYVSIGLLGEQASTDPFIISAFLVQPSAISHWSALQYHGLTEQIPLVITASTKNKIVTPSMRQKGNQHPKQKHAWIIDNVRYEYITIKEKHYNIGIEKKWIGDYCFFITNKERTILDVFINPKIFGGIGEALGILEAALPNININKLVEYAIQYDKKSVIKRLGWALENFRVPSKHLKPLLKIPINYYCRLDSAAEAKGPYDDRWMIQNNLKK